MKTSIYPFILASLLMSTNGCETTEKIDDFPLRPSSLVANCYFSSGNIWEFQVSKSLSVLDNADLRLLNKAHIKVFGDDELIFEIKEPDPDGWYRCSDPKPQMGTEYRIEVSAPGFEPASRARAELPQEVRITGAELIVKDSSFYEWTDYYGNQQVNGSIEGSFTVRFQDPPGLQNYYELSVMYFDSVLQNQNPDQIEVYQRNLFIFSEDASVDYGGDGSTMLLFRDQVFDGQEFQIKIDFNDWSGSRHKKYFITLFSLGYPGYFYKQTIAAYRDAVNDPFAEPVQIYTNIENGYGIFAGHAVSIFECQL